MKHSSSNAIGGLLAKSAHVDGKLGARGPLLLVIAVLFLLGDKCPENPPDILAKPEGKPRVTIDGTATINGVHYVKDQTFWDPAGGSRQVKATVEFQPFTNLRLWSGALQVGDRDHLDTAKTAYRRIQQRPLYDSATQTTPLTQVEVLAFKKTSVGKVFGLAYAARGQRGAEKRSERIKISWPKRPGASITAGSRELCEGDRANLDWRVDGVVNEVQVDGKRVSGAAVSPSGSLSSGGLDGKKTFTIVARGPGGTHSSGVTVTSEKCLDKKGMRLWCVQGCSGDLYAGPVFYRGTETVPDGWEIDEVKNLSSYYTLKIVDHGDLRAGKSSDRWEGRTGTLKIESYIECAPLIGGDCLKGVPSSLALELKIRKR